MIAKMNAAGRTDRMEEKRGEENKLDNELCKQGFRIMAFVSHSRFCRRKGKMSCIHAQGEIE